MNSLLDNYEYIIASLPERAEDAVLKGGGDNVTEEVRSLLSDSDRRVVDLLSEAFRPEGTDAAFYGRAASSPSRFIRDYFHYDLLMRNLKTEFLNRELGRPAGTDTVPDPYPAALTEGGEEIEAVLALDGILERERGLDTLMNAKAEELVRSSLFTLDVILSFLVRLRTASRWAALDPETGRAMCRALLDGMRPSDKKEHTL
ncbi:MAG: DUF2764 family protein [Bacteroidales bacterium]|nr:DUF2764 family protein [Bacteroidales bacterium]